MIKAIVYDKVANTQTGQMGGVLRMVGHYETMPGSDKPVKLQYIREEERRSQKVLVLTYEGGIQQIIPDRGVEKIFKLE